MPRYKYTLIDKNGTVDFGTENVQNWSELKPSSVRNSKYKGLVSSFTNTFVFTGDIRRRLRNLFDTDGTTAEAKLFIYAGNDNGERNSFKQLGEGQEFTADFTKFEIDETTCKLNFEDSSFQNKFFARSKSKINYDITENLDGGEMSPYELDELVLHDRELEWNSSTKPYTDDDFLVIYSTDTTLKSNIISKVDNNIKVVDSTPVTDINNPLPEQLFYLISESDRKLNLNFNYYLDTVITGVSITYAIKLAIYENGDNFDLVSTETIYTDSSPAGKFNVNFNKTIDVKEGYSLMLYTSTAGILGLAQDAENLNSVLEINSTEYFPATTAKAIRPFKAFERFTEMMTGEKTAFYSELFGTVEDGYAQDGEWSRLVTLNGKMIRGFNFGKFETADGKIISTTYNTSFDELYKAYNAVEPLALTIETVGGKQRIRIEKYRDIYKNEQALDFGTDISDLSRVAREDVLYTQIKCGYKDFEFEEVNGLDSAHGEMNLSTPLKSKDKVYDIVCPFDTGGYNVEIPRRLQYSTAATTDTKYDKRNYLIDAYESGGLLLARKDELFTSVTGILAPESAYNLRLSPKRNLLRHGYVIKESLTNNEAEQIIYTKGSTNQELITQLITESEAVIEKDNVNISDLERPILLAELLSYTAPLSIDDYNAWNNDKNNFCIFENRKELTGYIDDLEYNHPSQEVIITLIRANR